jgi:hypothetical protein
MNVIYIGLLVLCLWILINRLVYCSDNSELLIPLSLLVLFYMSLYFIHHRLSINLFVDQTKGIVRDLNQVR